MVVRIGSKRGPKRVLGMSSQTGTWTYDRQELAFLRKLNGVKLAFGKT